MLLPDISFGSSRSSVLAALNRSQAMITFSPSGVILDANKNFLDSVGYSLGEIKGKHHSMFMRPEDRDSAAYRQFWDQLGKGQFDSGQYRRVGKGGRGIWLQATYNPVLDRRGRCLKVVKVAADITAQKAQMADCNGQLAAIDKAQAVISFGLDGTILSANENFLTTLGYELADVVGKHHRIFMDETEAAGEAYRAFWDRLRRGEYDAGRYRRLGKAGREVWIQASYNPILDADGKPFKVVKYATDITAQVRVAQAMENVVAQTLGVVEAVKADNLTTRISMAGLTGDLMKVANGVNDLLDTLATLIVSVRDASHETLSASNEIREGSRDLAARTEQQAASLEETAATTEELAASVKATAQSARQAVEHANEARSVAKQGGETVNRAVEAMTRIEHASGKISEITAVIDEIAFQTNLLALNAAVEAARAGDAGKGFAVVAAEVRTLAQRSSDAAKDISGLISASTAQVAEGVKLVREAGTTLDRIVEASATVAETVGDISVATGEQANGIDEMSQVVAHMDQMTQQNAALAEEASASSAALSQQVEALASNVSRFRINRRDHDPVPTEHARIRELVSAAFEKPKRHSSLTRSASSSARKVAAGDWNEF